MAILSWTRVKAAWGAIGHALNAYTLVVLLSTFVSGAFVLGLLYAFADGYRDLDARAQVLFAGALFGGILLIAMAIVPWVWANRPLQLSTIPSSTLLAPNRARSSEPAIEEIELKLEQLKYTITPPWVHLKVINKGAPDEFKAEVTHVWYAEDEQTQYTMKWRESAEAVHRVYKDDLLDVAQIVVPTQTEPPSTGWPVGSTEEEGARESVRFERGHFRLFSATLPDGWPVHGQKELIRFLDSQSTVPPVERPLLVFEERLQLHVRVMGTRGQIASGRIDLGFQKPKWDYDRRNYESWTAPTATYRPDGDKLES